MYELIILNFKKKIILTKENEGVFYSVFEKSFKTQEEKDDEIKRLVKKYNLINSKMKFGINKTFYN